MKVPGVCNSWGWEVLPKAGAVAGGFEWMGLTHVWFRLRMEENVV